MPEGIGGRLACPAVPACLPPPCPPVGAGGLVDPLPEPRVVVVEGLAAVVAVDAAPSGGLCPSPGDPLCGRGPLRVTPAFVTSSRACFAG